MWETERDIIDRTDANYRERRSRNGRTQPVDDLAYLTSQEIAQAWNVSSSQIRQFFSDASLHALGLEPPMGEPKVSVYYRSRTRTILKVPIRTFQRVRDYLNKRKETATVHFPDVAPGQRGVPREAAPPTRRRAGITMKPTSRPGYSVIQAVSLLTPDSEAWAPFIEDVLNMPLSMLGAVQSAVKVKAWRLAKDPLQQVRESAENWSRRLADPASLARSPRNS